MIATVVDPKTIEMSQAFEEESFGITDEGLPYIFNILRNQLYSDKVLAVIREYTCNAFDAHIDGNCESRPVELTLPTPQNSSFHCRDFGPGMSEAEIRKIYANYGESTKRTSNKKIGMLGIGSKSAFAYGDNFVVVSYNGGKKTTYNCYIDPSQVGKIAKMAEEPWDGDTGIEIIVPVLQKDINDFHTKAVEFARFVGILGDTTTRPSLLGATVTIPSASSKLSGSDWLYLDAPAQQNNYYSRAPVVSSSRAVMGCIAYPIDLNQLKLPSNLSSLAQTNLILRLPIGDADIAANRESLQYSDKTKAALIKAITKVSDEIRVQIEKDLAAAKTPWEARCLFGTLSSGRSGLPNAIVQQVSQGLFWNGEMIRTASYEMKQDLKGTVLVRSARTPQKKQGFDYAEVDNVLARKDVVLLINDTNVGNWSPKRLETLFLDPKVDLVYTFTFPSDDIKDELLKKHKLEGADVRLLSSIPKAAPVKNISTASGRVINPKHSAKVFQFNEGNSASNVKSDAWDKAEVDLVEDEGVYLEIFGFEPAGKTSMCRGNYMLANLLGQLRASGISIPDIYGIKSDSLQKMAERDNWTCLRDYIRDQVTVKLSDPEERQRIHDFTSYQQHQMCWKQFTSLRNEIQIPDSLMKRYLDALVAMRVPKTKAEEYVSFLTLLDTCNLREKLLSDMEDSHDLSTLLTLVWVRYPMLALYAKRYNADSPQLTDDQDKRKVYAEYINQVDRCTMPLSV
jgi:hypothetical protein